MTQRDSDHTPGSAAPRSTGDGAPALRRTSKGASDPTDHPFDELSSADSAFPRPRSEVSLRGPAELADALPYLLGFHPDDSIVVVAVHGERGRLGGRIRIGLTPDPAEWPALSSQVAACLEGTGLVRDSGPDGALLFLCRDPEKGETGRQVMERLRPLAQSLRTACGARDMPVYEALCLSDGRYWSYCCPDDACCPLEGKPLKPHGTSTMAAAAAYAGLTVRGSLREMQARLATIEPPLTETQVDALDATSVALVPRMLTAEGRTAVGGETLQLLESLMARFHASKPPEGLQAEADGHDDALLSAGEAAAVLLGLQDREVRDRAAEWMEGPEAAPALRLWRALARRCVAPYSEHAAAPLTLAGWVAWSSDFEPEARVALDKALHSDPEYTFAHLLHRAFNDGMDPEPLRACLRKRRAVRLETAREEQAAHDQAAEARRAAP